MIPKLDVAARDETGVFVDVNAFGSNVRLEAARDSVAVAQRLRELKEDYERFLASRVLPKTGLCTDLGAGEGWFALPFATAFPGWRVIAFESDTDAFARLQANVERLGLENVTCINASLHPDLEPATGESRIPGSTELPKSLKKALARPVMGTFTPVLAFAPRVAPANGAKDQTVSCPALPVDILAKLVPDLVKLDAPGCEKAIARTLREVPVGFLTGRLYSYVPSRLFHPADAAGAREFYLTYGEYALRRDYEDNFPTRRPRLDVVVAMYNTRDYILECIDSVLADGNPDINVIVVDDGSTDGCGALVASRFAGNDRVRLLYKANGGCASARNYGRRYSDATHIAFIDADDRVDPGMFTALLEVARYTGAFVTEAEFAFLTLEEETGSEVLTLSYETSTYPLPGDKGVGPHEFFWISGQAIAAGQPTIWRRVHRRDFLDRKNIWFPEHVRAFDDQIFQLMVAHYSGSLAHLKGHAYHYRQHPAQDIKQGDERHFYSFNMFRKLFLRALDEHWPDITPLARSLLNTMAWSYGGLRDDLKMTYQEGAAKFLAIVSKTFDHVFTPQELSSVGIEGLDFLVDRHLKAIHDQPANYGFMRLESWRWQPEFLRMMQAVKSGD
ncbi:FkbM family methyltransferase [Seohaeicola zhoushanensis]|uniref:tRNA (guanine(46)-N(7))-methyltransferase n=1 Tax=Seohaeicola zhoushanensis TaxID=1569283 RepID=A0A8J3MB07_9RHOB|nr:FkbM family methyltransferase [Seohaeicola zhoushanensis]GHF71820.1 hypothetical protein GCM10017056_48380 [Seohaeicola zhoushanensis]